MSDWIPLGQTPDFQPAAIVDWQTLRRLHSAYPDGEPIGARDLIGRLAGTVIHVRRNAAVDWVTDHYAKIVGCKGQALEIRGDDAKRVFGLDSVTTCTCCVRTD